MMEIIQIFMVHGVVASDEGGLDCWLIYFFVDHYGCLGGGNSNIFYFHPETWGRFSPNFDVCISAYFSDGLVETANQM